MSLTSTAKDIYRRARRGLKAAMGRDLWIAPDLRVPKVRLGTAYGGWSIRPEGLGPNSVVYSFGVGRDVSWDLAMIERFGVSVDAFDPTPKCIAWVNARTFPTQFRFHPIGVAAFDGDATFVLRSDDPEWDSYNLDASTAGATEVHKLPVRRVSTIMRERGHQRIDVMKIDIEGAEYEVVDDMLASGVTPAQLLVEYHYFEGGPERIERTRKSIEALRGGGYRLFDRSAVGHEFSFGREGGK
jgi:FkbM family methyltransferase